jgi:hypothetical protein
MSRRQLSLLVVTIASLIVTACASPTAPQASPKKPTAPRYDIGVPDSHG